ncbi:MAG: UDP-N-acetylmuramoylalanyl-D-glutamyl-2,6-diaminopimelate--D-alanyl-D-alanine ligase [Rhodospirillales bacterium]
MTGAPVLWTAAETAAATGGDGGTASWAAGGVSIDTRTLAPGDLFVAILGPRFDGHAFVAEAFGRGAVAAVVSRGPADVPAGAPLLVVRDTLRALEDLGRCARVRSRARIVGVTGSVGKTGVKEALNTVLSAQAPTAATAGNLNNHWGLPLSLARLPREAAFGVFEMGMNHPGELDRLTRLARPHVAVITTVDAVHKQFFASIEAIADAKAEIFRGVEPGGAAVLNRDNGQFARLAAVATAHGVRIVGFGRHDHSTVRLVSAVQDDGGASVEASVEGRIVDYRINVPGRHWIANSLCVLAAVLAAGADVDAAAAALARVVPAKGRGQRFAVTLAGGRFEVIDDSYNASPVSMAAAFDVLGRARPGPGGRRLAMLGDMLELGEDSASLHAALAGPLAANGIDLVFTAGAAMAHLAEALPAAMCGGHAPDSRALVAFATAAVRAGDVVTVKGSAGSRMGLIVEALRALDRGETGGETGGGATAAAGSGG